MPLVSSSLETKIKDKLTAAGFDLDESPKTVSLAKAIAEAVVEEITTNAQVTKVQSGTGTANIS